MGPDALWALLLIGVWLSPIPLGCAAFTAAYHLALLAWFTRRYERSCHGP